MKKGGEWEGEYRKGENGKVNVERGRMGREDLEGECGKEENE